MDKFEGYSHRSRSDENDEHFIMWQNSIFNQNSQLGELGAFQNHFDRNSRFGNSVLSIKSLQINQFNQENKDHIYPFSMNINTPYNSNQVSISDMLKTNCSRKDINSIQGIDALDKLSLKDFNRVDNGNDDLQEVSNRKLQNRVNAKRARQKKKKQVEQMRQLIFQLQTENTMLKQSLKKRDGQTQKDGNSWRYCRRCQQQLISTVFVNYSKEKYEQKGLKKIHSIKFRDEEQYPEQVDKGQSIASKMHKIHNKQHQSSNDASSQMEAQFEEIDFYQNKQKNNEEQIEDKSKRHKNNNQNRNNQNFENHRRMWVGKIWIAVGLLMLIIGIQLFGVDSTTSDSFIRIRQKQLKKWAQQFEDQSVQSFTIKMKTKLPYKLIENQKQMKSERFKKEKQKNRYKQEWQRQQQYYKNRQNSHKQEKSNKNSAQRNENILNAFSFQSQQMYSRKMFEQQEAQLQIKKDLLYSIYAQFDDIGRYI